MHREFDWATPADTYILDFLSQCEGKLKVSSIALNVPYKQQWVGKRCRELSQRGLLNRISEGAYEITDLGEQYLSGELDAVELEAEDADDEGDDE